MPLKHDAQGFLVGTPIDLGAATKSLSAIRSDVRAILSAVAQASSTRAGSNERSGARSQSSAGTSADQGGSARTTRAVATPGGSSGASGGDASAASRPGSGGVSRARVATPVRPAVDRVRDANGRFKAGGGGDGGAPGGGDSGSGRINSFLSRISRAVLDSGAGIEDTDPTVKAFNEIAQPMARGYEMLAGSGEDKKQTGFLRRIFTTLNVFRKEETALDKATVKSLKAIESKDVAAPQSGGGGVLGAIGGALANIPLVGPILKKGAGMLGGMLPKGGGLLAKLGKGVLKRGPLVGPLVSGALAWNEASAAEMDPTLTADQKNAKKGAAWGGAAGNLAGTVIGSLAGPVGAIVGGVVGDWLGGQLGEMIGSNWADVTASISTAWDGCVKRFDGFVDSAKPGWDTVTGWFSAAYEGLKNIPVIGDAIKKAGELATAAKGKAVEVVGAAKDKVVEVAGAAKDKAVAVGGAAVDSAKKGVDYVANNTVVGRAAKSAGNWVLGQTSKLFESGKGGAATVSSGKGDLGGASYGTYQLSSKMGEVQKFLGKSGYGKQFEGLQPGTKEFDAKWKEVAAQDPAFASAQHDYIKDTKFDPQMDRLKKAGIDLSGRGAAVQDAVWSTSVQFGGKTSLIEKALKGKDPASMSDAEITSAIQDYKLANNDTLFKSSSASVRAGTAKRAADEKSKYLELAAASPSVPSVPAVSASANSPAIPAAPAIPAVAEAPPVIDPMATTGGKSVAMAAVNSPDVGQDLRDRRIAHVATGGIAV